MDAQLEMSNDLGSLAHLAIAQWIHSDDWQSTHSPELLFRRFTDLVTGPRAKSARYRLIASRLRARAPQLQNFLKEWPNPAIQTEVTLLDQQRKLWGRADILIRSADRIGLIEIKSGEKENTGISLSTDESRQIRLYAHLISCTYTFPDIVILFSLKRGLIEVPVSAEAVTNALDEAMEARRMWFSGQRKATPHPDKCRFCPQRIRCSPSWRAIEQ